jgi:excisionase family DNA binding protein
MKGGDMTEELLEVIEVAEILRYNPYTVREKLRTGEIKGVKLPRGRWRVKRADLEAYIGDSKKGTEG